MNLANAPESRPLAPRDDNTRSYLTNLKEYEQRFGWQAMLNLLETMPCPLPGSWSDMSYHLAISLWEVGGATILGHQLLAEKRPYSANCAAPVHSHLGAVDKAVCQATTNGQREIANAILKIWQQNKGFWQRDDMQQFLLVWQKDTLMTTGYQTEAALQHLTQQASLGLIPMSTAQQVQLLAQALQSGQDYWPQSLLSAWILMATKPQQALAVAHQFPPLEKLLWHNSDYAYITWGLQGSSNDEIDQMISMSTGSRFIRMRHSFYSWRERDAVAASGFTAGELLLVLDNQADILPKVAVESLVSQILQQPNLLASKRSIGHCLYCSFRWEGWSNLRNWCRETNIGLT
ncbi:MAG: hypothetical protein IPH82_19700 [Chloroflexi bacterium]|nr:hypothetical protein [Chloroflexota bacterium]